MNVDVNEINFKLYAVFIPDPGYMIEFARQHIFSRNVGGLFSFAPFMNKAQTDDFPKLGTGRNWLFADSGSFSARNNNPQLFLKHPIDELFQYYRRFDFDYIVEPDYIVNDYNATNDRELDQDDVYERNLEFSAQLGILRSFRLKEVMGSDAYKKVVRPLHGHTARQRLTYLEMLESYLDKVGYVALGGLDTKKFDKTEFEKTLDGLQQDHNIRKIHFFGRSSADALDYAISKAAVFDEVSVDSTSWLEKAKFRQFYWFDEDHLLTKTLKADAGEREFQNNLDLLDDCPCPACNPNIPSLGKIEAHDYFSLRFLADQSRLRNPSYETPFVQKTALHNLYHQRLYIEHRLKNTLCTNP